MSRPGPRGYFPPPGDLVVILVLAEGALVEYLTFAVFLVSPLQSVDPSIV